MWTQNFEKHLNGTNFKIVDSIYYHFSLQIYVKNQHIYPSLNYYEHLLPILNNDTIQDTLEAEINDMASCLIHQQRDGLLVDNYSSWLILSTD
jgi:hypothetical protein